MSGSALRRLADIRDLKAGERFILNRLCFRHWEGSDDFLVSVAWLMSETGYARSSVFVILAKLRRRGLIITRSARDGSFRCRLCFDDPVPTRPRRTRPQSKTGQGSLPLDSPESPKAGCENPQFRSEPPVQSPIPECDQTVKPAPAAAKIKTPEEERKIPGLRPGAASGAEPPPMEISAEKAGPLATVRASPGGGARGLLFVEGPKLVQQLTGLTGRQARGFLAGMVRRARDDCALVLEVLRHPENEQPIAPCDWLMARVDRRRSGLGLIYQHYLDQQAQIASGELVLGPGHA